MTKSYLNGYTRSFDFRSNLILVKSQIGFFEYLLFHGRLFFSVADCKEGELTYTCWGHRAL